MSRKCSSLQSNEQVVFNLYSEIFERKLPMDGSVIFVLPNRKEVMVSYLEGYKDRHDNISYEDMLAVYDKDGEEMYFENIHGPSELLIAE